MQRREAVAWTLASVFFACSVCAGIRFYLTRLRIHFAYDQVTVIESAVDSALTADQKSRIELAEYIRNYYPSGTKQVIATPLDGIVESARRTGLRALGECDAIEHTARE